MCFRRERKLRELTVNDERLKITARREYEYIINARNFHYKEFNNWSRYFGLIIGALFAAYYSIGGKPGLHILVAIIGFLVSMCWYWSNKGYTYWWSHWSNFLQEAEKNREGGIPESDGVYTSFSYKSEGLWSNFKRYICPFKGANISTSKVVLLMSFSVACAWGVVLCKDIILNGNVIKNNSIVCSWILSKRSLADGIVAFKDFIVDYHIIIELGCFMTYLVSLVGTLFIKSDLSKHKPI